MNSLSIATEELTFEQRTDDVFVPALGESVFFRVKVAPVVCFDSEGYPMEHLNLSGHVVLSSDHANQFLMYDSALSEGYEDEMIESLERRYDKLPLMKGPYASLSDLMKDLFSIQPPSQERSVFFMRNNSKHKKLRFRIIASEVEGSYLERTEDFFISAINENVFFQIELIVINLEDQHGDIYPNKRIKGHIVSSLDKDFKFLMYDSEFSEGDFESVVDSMQYDYENMSLVKGDFDSLEDFMEALIEQQY